MSTCGSSLRQIFESTIQEKNSSSSSSLIESLSSSLKQIRPVKPPLEHSFTEIFGELHFKESSEPIYSSSSSTVSYNGGGDDNKWWNNCADDSNKRNAYHKKSDSFSSLNSESLQLCTEGLGSESLDYMEDLKIDNDMSGDNYCFTGCKMGEKSSYYRGNSVDQYRKRRTDGETFPPPISCIGKTGKPSVWFQSFREDGRFVLKEVRIPTYERLHASREDGNLRLRFIQPSDRDDDDEGEEQRKVKEETEVTGDIEGGHS